LVKLALELCLDWNNLGNIAFSSLNNGIDDWKEPIQYRLGSGGASSWGQESSSAGAQRNLIFTLVAWSPWRENVLSA
jgi:hypothetical protein